MKVGDLVERSYGWGAPPSGIIVDEKFEKIGSAAEMGIDEYTEFRTQQYFIVCWSDGAVTEEMDIELDPLHSFNK